MFRFRDESSDNLFEFALKAQLGDKELEPKLLCVSSNQCFNNFKDEIKKIILPLKQNQFNKWNDSVYVNTIQNTKISGFPQIIYIYIKYVKIESNYFAYCIISKYMHYQLITKALNDICAAPENELASIYEKYRRISFRKNAYDIVAEYKNEVIMEGLISNCEIAKMNRFFLSNYPPYYAGLLIYLLLKGKRIIVLSADFKHLSSTVFATAALLYPLDFYRQNDDGSCINFIPVLPKEKIGLLKCDGPSIYGIHATMINELFTLKKDYILFNADEPYISNLDENDKDLTNDDNLYTIFETINFFHEKIIQLCNADKVVFPGPFIFSEIQSLIRDLLFCMFKKQSITEISKVTNLEKTSMLLYIAFKKAKENNKNLHNLLERDPKTLKIPIVNQVKTTVSSKKKK